MKLFNGRVFDSVISLGFNCRCAMYLRDHRLRDCSSPYDWVQTNFEQKIKTICYDFKDFLRCDTLVRVPEKHAPGDLVEHDRYDDKITGFLFAHDFPVGVPLEESFPAVRAKYDRRISRFLARLDGGGSYLLVWWGGPHVEDGILLDAYRRLCFRFKASRLSLLVIDNVAIENVVSGAVEGSDGRVWRVSGPFVSDELDMVGNKQLCDEVFDSIRLRGTFHNKFRWAAGRFLVHALTWYLPTKDLRRRFRYYLEPIFMGTYV